MGGQGLAISVETHPSEFARTLDQQRLAYAVFRSRRRWLFVTGFVPHPAAEATSRFLHRVVLPEMLLEHVHRRYSTMDPEDRLLVWQQTLPLLAQRPLVRGTAALLLPELVEHGRLSVAGWLRFRGERFLRALVAELARTGFQQLWLERALRQSLGALRAPGAERHEELVVEGQGQALEIRTPDGRRLYREFLDGHLDPRIGLGREDLAVGLLRALAPRRVRARRVSAQLLHKLRAAGVPVEAEPGPGGAGGYGQVPAPPPGNQPAGPPPAQRAGHPDGGPDHRP